eukprot:CAMPEP_0201635480 /NCGR_PEP_ID=MMETSP0493-20130528/7999_1 /ASSEMBLY_ACC=CAM_ASM_000838 /TAXON_ID=420259 /ORGANISM="Thalassiosira gravida, Strain GMp14c1" /LENGTH=610 /DNA_ID=CAMNT_0048107453 /DNA_START=126 /DNA_END=1958 /DNA_ORIENTATION=+
MGFLSSALHVILLSDRTIAAIATSATTLTSTSWLESISSRLLLRTPETPDELFNTALAILGFTIVGMRSSQFLAVAKINKTKSNDDDNKNGKSKSKSDAVIKSLQQRYLPVFWLLRLSFWMSGPYFHQVYSSKTFNGQPVTLSLISRIFLAGFGSIALFGPGMGRLLDIYGGRRGTLAACAIYALGALSTLSNSLPVLFVGRAVGGLGTNLLSSAPETWLVREANRKRCPTGDGDDEDDELPSRIVRETFRRAYTYDSLVAIASGQIGGYVARRNGPTGPFMLLPAFLLVGSVIVLLFWGENNTATISNTCGKYNAKQKQKKDEETLEKGGLTIRDGIQEIWDDKKLLALGAVQSLFEGSMCIFVSQWPPAVSRAVVRKFGENAHVPYGTVFSCFMACCMLGSTILGGLLSAGLHTDSRLEKRATKMFAMSALSIACTTYASAQDDGLYVLLLGMFAFEACVGMYFPVIGTMRSRYLPTSHRSVIMSIYGVPLNVLVVSVFLYIGRLGVTGAFAVATVALVTAVLCMLALQGIRAREARQHIKMVGGIVKARMNMINSLKEAAEAQRSQENSDDASSVQVDGKSVDEDDIWLDHARHSRHNRGSLSQFQL